MGKGTKRARKSSSSKRRSVKQRSFKKQAAGRTTAVSRSLKYAEKKNIDTNLGGAGGNVDTAYAPLLCLCVCKQGAGAMDRIGRRINVSSIFVRGKVWAGLTQSGPAHFRMIIFVDHDPNGVVPTAAQVLEQDNYNSFSNLGNSKRFKILAEITPENGELLSTDTMEGFTFSRYIKTNITVGYNNSAGAGAATDVLTNGIYAIVYCGGTSLGSTIAPTLECKSRVRFTDM